MDDFEPKIVAFSCNWCCCSDVASISGTRCSSSLGVVTMTCSCKANEVLVLKAFAAGADGVLIDGCLPEECSYTKDSLSARQRIGVLRLLLEAIGVSTERLRLEPSSPQQDAILAERLGSFAQTIKRLGPSPFSRKTY
jgi:F420-non-reducing hydrogenase iron-sulfur subunit